MRKLTVGSVCTGYGGLELALGMAGVEHRLAWVADPDPAATALLAHHHPGVPNLGDITTADWSAVGPVDMVLAGWPCQPWSAAGKRKGAEDERAIWPAVAHAIRCLRPRHVFLENVPRIVAAGELARVVTDLAAQRYVGSWRCVRASDVGAAHKRERVFIYAKSADAESLGHGDAWAEGGQGIPAAAVSGALLPTPDATHGRKTTRTPLLLPGVVELLPTLPTPTAVRYGSNQSGSDGAAVRYGLDSIDRLLPTPLASANENRQTRRSPSSQEAGTHGRNLAAEVCALLPTPWASEGAHGGPNQRGSKGDLMLSSAVQLGRWGQYGPAIQRWAEITGTPAPEPTEPNSKGGQRLSPRFVEWLMGLYPGHVTGVHGLSRNDQLRLLGNGVVPRQGARAIRLMSHLREAAPACA